MFAVAALAAVVFTSWLLARWLHARGPDWAAMGYTFAACLILIYGYVLSECQLLGTPWAWCVFAVLGAIAASLVARRWPLTARPEPDTAAASPDQKATRGERVALAMVGATATALAAVNLGVVLFALCPENDSLNCHLPRVIHFWQQGNLDNYPTTFWGQTTHPRHQPILLGFWYMVGGENLTQMVHFLSYLALIGAVYGIGRRLGTRPAPAALSALIAGLLTNMLLICTSTQNDMIIAAGVALATYFLLSFRATRQTRFLALAPWPVALLIGVKGSAVLCVPSLALVAGYAVWPAPQWPARQALAAAGCLMALGAAAAAVLVLPCGYLLTWRTTGSPLGPESVYKKHTYAGVPAGARVADGVRNLLRYLVELSSLDGLPKHRLVSGAQQRWHRIVIRATTAVGISLEERTVSGRPTFQYRPPQASRNASHWGFLGLAVLGPGLVLTFVRRGARPGYLILGAAWLVFLLVQAFSRPYDPWSGRYFLWATALAAPAACLLLEPMLRRAPWAPLAMLLLAAGCFSAVSTVLFNSHAPVWHGRDPFAAARVHTSVFARNRIDRIAVRDKPWAETLRRFEQIVPADATVALRLSYPPREYGYFGPAGKRRLITANEPIPDQAFYLYTADLPRHADDVFVGKGQGVRGQVHRFYLRLPSSASH
jgi:hypothetical protein